MGLFILGLLPWAASLDAADAARSRSDASNYEELLALLGDETEIATKNGMNADFIPGMATILRGDELMMRGTRTVWEALSLVPGIAQSLEVTGERQVLSRGVGHGYASGNIKILLDGVSMNATFDGTANPVLNIPVEQIQRIEVIRGPGSSVYGEYAYAGVVNIITRSNERTLHAQGGGSSDYGGGAIWYWELPEKALRVSINVAGLDGDGGEVRLGKDALYSTGQRELSNAPGTVNEDLRYGALFGNIQWAGYSLSFNLLDDSYGDHFGINHFLPPDKDGLASRQRYYTVQLGRDIRFSNEVLTRVRLEGMSNRHQRNHLYVLPPNYIDNPEPVYMDRDYVEKRYLGAVDVHWKPNLKNHLLLGLEASQVSVDKATWNWSGLTFPISDTWLDPGHSRTIYSFLVQDEYRPSDRLTLTGTLRYDDYSDSDSFLSPRLAAVWRFNDESILKAQYALAFRPPTFYELEYPALGEISSSNVSTFELGYVLKKRSWETRLIAYESVLNDPITFRDGSNDGFFNAPDVRLHGIEVEYLQRFGVNFKIDANASYVDTQQMATNEDLPGGAAVLGNLALLWKPHAAWTAALQGQYVGDRKRRVGTCAPPWRALFW